MRNRHFPFGVYSITKRMALAAACWFAAAAQPAPPDGALTAQVAILKSLAVRDGTVPGEFATARDEARRLLAAVPVEDASFLSSMEQVAHLYGGSGWRVKAIGVYQDALARASALPVWHPSRVRLLLDLAAEWEDDGNLLKALPLMEQAVAAEAAAPPNAPTGKDPRAFLAQSSGPKNFSSCGERPEPLVAPYIRLARLYRQLGRVDAAAAMVAKLAALGSHGGMELADYYEFSGNMDDSAVLYRRIAQDSTNPRMAAVCLQKAADAFRAAQRYDDAIAASRDAISLAQKVSDAGAPDQVISLRQDLAMQLQGAGQVEESDRIYQTLMQSMKPGENADQLAMSYARYLAITKRTPQGDKFLEDYWDQYGAAASPPRSWVLNQLAAYAEQNGHTQAAAEYRQQAAALNPPHPPSDPQAGGAVGELRQVDMDFKSGKSDELFARTLHAIETAPPADLQSIAWLIPGIAEKFLASKQPEKANQVYQKMLARAQFNAEDDVTVLVDVRRRYIRFLLPQRNRLADAETSIDQLRLDLTGARGPDSAKLTEPVEFKLELERARSDVPRAEAAGEEMLAMEASLTGRSSEAYFNRLGVVGELYEKDEHYSHALPLRAQSVLLADLLATPNNKERRVTARISFALTLAHVGKFREAEAMGREAVEIQKASHAPPWPLDPQLKKIQELEQTSKDKP